MRIFRPDHERNASDLNKQQRTSTKKRSSAYANSGVDIDVMVTALGKVRKAINGTRTKEVVREVGSFGGLYRVPGTDWILVSSIDGVGTKLKVAQLANRHGSVGQDLVNHCVNDILTQGARPIFFLDYLGTAKLDPQVFSEVVAGLCKACRKNACALLGGETAEMPGLYPAKEYDLVGSIVGLVRKKDLITGAGIRNGDTLLGLPSTGLHTNGYSLAREVLLRQANLKPSSRLPGSKKTVADHLLAIHKSYLNPVQDLMRTVTIRGIAHITGGGLVDNVPRMLPKGLCAAIDRESWRTPHLFEVIQSAGNIETEEMYRVFNMGIGLVLSIRTKDVETSLVRLRKSGEKPRVIGKVIRNKVPLQWT